MIKYYQAEFTPIEFLIVEELPDVTGKVYLLHKKKPLQDGEGEIDVYEEWLFTRELIGYIEPDEEVQNGNSGKDM